MPSDDRPKRSWRDIDKMRDGGGGSRGPSSSRSDPHEERQSKQHRAALEALFNKGPGAIGKLAEKLAPPPVSLPAEEQQEAQDPQDDAETVREESAAPVEPAAKAAASAAKKKPGEDRLTLRRKIMEAAGRHEITKAAEKYLERFPLPDDHEFLEQLLEHEQEPRALQAMERIAYLLDRQQKPKRQRALCGKLRYLSETSGNEDLRAKAQELLRRLG